MEKRVKTGIPGLDEMLGGGFLPRTANLVEGPPGTGKTTLGMQFIFNGIAQYHEPGLILTFEEFPEQFYRDANSFGWDFKALESQGKLKVIMTSPEVAKSDLESGRGSLETTIMEMGVKRILVDSVSHFARLARDPLELRRLEYSFINRLKGLELTSILTRESQVLFGGTAESDGHIAFTVDSYLLLRYVEIESEVRKALLVLKLRGSDHVKEIRQFEITSQGLVIARKFEGQEGVMSGSPHRAAMEKGFEKAFIANKGAKAPVGDKSAR